ncbi:hypothetical protein [Bosea sp. RAC05]|uniref:hypothetical protein n=1 Tax=Bosea sp. RAC05 TaxID=1842539 RepID=UPI00083CE5FE|nr:hypothetical protein [Bosea sp. RAC05]AOG03395.1 hypothetical protein BSY19_5375 [Bosea sp. RAC05]
MNPDVPSYPSPLEVGDEALVTGTLCVTNSSGGTTIIRHAGMTCRVTKSFWDYECGWRFHGTPVNQGDVGELRRQGTTGIDPEVYRERYPNNPDLHTSAVEAARTFDPGRVFFSEHDVAPSPKPGPA